MMSAYRALSINYAHHMSIDVGKIMAYTGDPPHHFII